MSRRRSTIHDAAALRLHPNGVRVNDTVQDTLWSVGTVKTRTSSLRLSRKLARGNWIATDAGGDGRVSKRRKISRKDTEAGISAAVDNQGAVDAAQEQPEELPTRIYKDMRANRRMAFENDLTFLAAPTSVHKGNGSHLQPSSDFLKCIHHFASKYYGSRGQCFDSAGAYRKVKKENRQRRMLQSSGSRSKDPETSQGEGEFDEEDKQTDDECDHSQNIELNISSKETSSTPKSQLKPKGKAKGKSGLKTTQKDMYKAFDGSALLCIGALLQTHIASSLEDNMLDTREDDGNGAEGSLDGSKSEPSFVTT